MHFIMKQIIITTVADHDIKTVDEIRGCLTSILGASVDCKVVYKDPLSGIIKRHEKCRLSNLNDDKVDIKVFQQSAKFRVAGVNLSDIIELEIETKQRNIIAGNEKMNRFNLMDIPAGEKVEENKEQ